MPDEGVGRGEIVSRPCRRREPVKRVGNTSEQRFELGLIGHNRRFAA
jgi:hypothetical protein